MHNTSMTKPIVGRLTVYVVQVAGVAHVMIGTD